MISRICLPTAASTCLPAPPGFPSDQLQEPYDPWRLCLSLCVGVHELGHTSGISTAVCLGNVFLAPDLCQLVQNVMTGPRVPAWDGSNKSLWTVSLYPLPLLHGKTPRDEISAWNGVVPTLYIEDYESLHCGPIS